MEITGPMTATLWAATDAKDTDWNVMLLDVYPDGRVLRIQDGVARARFREGFDRPKLLTPGTVNRYDIDLWYTGIVIPAGHRLRVTVASAAFPKYDRNLNTGGDNERETKFVSARQRVLHDAEHPSRVRLPVIPGNRGTNAYPFRDRSNASAAGIAIGVAAREAKHTNIKGL
jgi:putative CocE/NonD family hydrolase